MELDAVTGRGIIAEVSRSTMTPDQLSLIASTVRANQPIHPFVL
jgi:hypothetical protein